MGSTSKILLPGELASVTPIWWRDMTPPPPAVEAPELVMNAVPPIPDSERERIEREAYQRGFAEGKNLGKEQSSAEQQPVLDRLSRSLAEIAALKPRMRREAEKDLVKLSIAIARRVLHRELTLDPESIEGLLKVALDRLESRELCTVRMHSSQEAAIRKLLDRFAGVHKIEIIADKSLAVGDVLLETPNGMIDASVDAQLSEIERGFADRLRR